MRSPSVERLALDGGRPVRSEPFPTVFEAAGRRLGDDEKRALERVIDSGTLSSTFGREVRELEDEFSAYYDVSSTIASSSGTAALHAAVGAVDPNPGDEIITTPISDAGTVLPIVAQNAIPVFADVEAHTGNIDVESVRALVTERTRAILAVHLFGIPANVRELRACADEHGLVLIEDCAQAYLTECVPDGALAGTVGHLGCFSLQQSKHITAGDGGLTIANDARLARRARLFVDKAWPRDTNERTHLFLGLNYRMTELQGAVARVQLPKLADVVAARRERAAQLTKSIASLGGLGVAPAEGTSYYLFPLYVDPAVSGGMSADWAAALSAEGIPASAGYIQRPLYAAPLFRDARTYGESGYPFTSPPAATVPSYGDGVCPVAEELLARRLVVILWNENYTDDDVADIAEAVAKVHAAFGARPVRSS